MYLQRKDMEGEALKDFTVFLFARGEAYVHLSGSTLRVRPCQVLLGYPGERVGFEALPGETFSYLSLGVVFVSCQDRCREARLYTLQSTKLFWEVVREFDLPNGPSSSAFFVRAAKICKLLALLMEEDAWQESSFEHTGGTGEAAGEKPVLLEEKENEKAYAQKAKALIEAHFQEGIRIAELAGKIGISRYYLATIFHREMGVSPQEYLMQIRMDRAASYLRETEEAIKSVAEQVGYTDSLAFSKAFRRRFGLSPSEYRRQEKK